MTLIIGDIHGCYDELQALLDRAAIASDEPIIALGDIVDRGPASPQTLAFFRDHPHAASLTGNHERKHVGASRGKMKLAASQRITRQQFEETNTDYEAALSYMSSLPLYLQLPEAILIHGYLEPGVPLHAQKPSVLAGGMSGEKYLKSNYPQPWYELVEADRPIIVGHREYAADGEPFVYKDRVFGLDTGCYAGRRLTGLVLPAFRFVSVPATDNHWLRMRRLYPHLRRRLKPPPTPEKMNWHLLAHWIAQNEDRQHWAQQMQEAQQTFPAIYRWAQAQHERVLAALPDLAHLPPKKQGKHYDQAISHLPAPARPLLHRMRQGKLSIEDVPKIVRSLRHVQVMRELMATRE